MRLRDIVIFQMGAPVFIFGEHVAPHFRSFSLHCRQGAPAQGAAHTRPLRPAVMPFGQLVIGPPGCGKVCARTWRENGGGS